MLQELNGHFNSFKKTQAAMKVALCEIKKNLQGTNSETLQARRGWKEVFKVMKDKDLHPRLLYPAKLSFIIEGQIKCFPNKVKLKEFIITSPYYTKC